MGVSTNPYATELHTAVLSGRILSVRRFLDRGARVTARDKIDRTPLHWAVAAGLEDIAKVLLISTPPRSLKAGDKYGRTVLHYAAASGNVSLARVMINRGAAVSAEDRRLVTPLHLAAEQVNPEMVQLLLGHGAACAAQDAEGRTPRGFAERVGSADCARLLREAEARVTDRSLREAEARVAEAGVAEAGVAEAGVAEAGVAEAGVAEAGVAEAGVAGGLAAERAAAMAVSSAAGRGSSRSSSHLGALSTEADGRMKENVSVRDLCALGGAWECKSEKLSTPGAGLAAATLPAGSSGPLQPLGNRANASAADTALQRNGPAADTLTAAAAEEGGAAQQHGGFVAWDAEERRLGAGESYTEAGFRIAVPPYAGRAGAGEVGFTRSGFGGARCAEKPRSGWDEAWGVLGLLGAF